jgi:hypothetical protein
MNISYSDLIGMIKKFGAKEESDRGPVTEIIGPQLFFRPGTLVSRKGMNKRLAMLEASMFCSGTFLLNRIRWVAPKANTKLYAWQSDYGPRTHQQFQYVVNELTRNRASRKAVVDFKSILYSDITYEEGYARDLACTTGMQFLIRDNHMLQIVTMRSCDIVYGLPMDMFMFGMVAQMIANAVGGIKSINSCLQIGSLHLYDSTAHLAEETADPEYVSLIDRDSIPATPVARLHDIQDTFSGLSLDGALNDPATWADFKRICAWPLDFSTSDKNFMEIPS